MGTDQSHRSGPTLQRAQTKDGQQRPAHPAAPGKDWEAPQVQGDATGTAMAGGEGPKALGP